jgi:hypothetical protein
MNLLNPLNLRKVETLGSLTLGYKTPRVEISKRSPEPLGHLHPDYRHLIYFRHS